MKDKINILVVAGTMNVGGIENQLMHLIRNADKTIYSFDYTTTIEQPYYKDEIERCGGRCILINSTNNGKNIIGYCRSLYKIIKDGKYDVVHSHELFHSGIVLFVAKIAGVKCRIAHAHNWAEGNSINEKKSLIRCIYNSIMHRWIIKYSTDYCACSSLAAKYVFGDDVINHSNYHLIYNSIDTSKYLENYNSIENGEFVDNNWINIIHIGRYTDVKNQLFLVQIAEELKRRNKRIRILCVGDKSTFYGKEAQAKIQEKNLNDYIKLIGIRKDIDILLRKSSAFVLPSKYEGMPLVLIEAQAAGLPCVVADTFSHEVDFDIGMVDWLSIDESIDCWISAIEEALQKKKANKKDVEKAINSKGFSSKCFSQKVCEIYRLAYERQKD